MTQRYDPTGYFYGQPFTRVSEMTIDQLQQTICQMIEFQSERAAVQQAYQDRKALRAASDTLWQTQQ